MGKSKTAKIKVTAKPKTRTVKPKLSSNNGGLLTAKVHASINKNKK